MNDLTGDYDVVAQFTVDAVNRVLAAMHRGRRFPHSLSVSVDDTPKSASTPKPSNKVARSIVDVYGNAISDRVLVAQTAARPPISPAGPFIDVGLLGPAGNIRFNQWTPSPHLIADDLKAVNKALHNSLKTGFQ